MTRSSAIGYRATISAGASFISNGRNYVFDNWSDGGAQSHDVTIPATPTTVTANYRDAGPVGGLVMGFGFEEVSGAAVTDSSGRGNVGAVLGAARVTGGRFGRALSFDGVDDWVTVADSASLDLTSGMTLEAWVRPDAPLNSWQTLLMKERPGGFAYALYVTAWVRS